MAAGYRADPPGSASGAGPERQSAGRVGSAPERRRTQVAVGRHRPPAKRRSVRRRHKRSRTCRRRRRTEHSAATLANRCPERFRSVRLRSPDRPVATTEHVSPSISECAGRIALARPSWADWASRPDSGRVSAASRDDDADRGVERGSSDSIPGGSEGPALLGDRPSQPDRWRPRQTGGGIDQRPGGVHDGDRGDADRHVPEYDPGRRHSDSTLQPTGSGANAGTDRATGRSAASPFGLPARRTFGRAGWQTHLPARGRRSRRPARPARRGGVRARREHPVGVARDRP